MVYPILDSTLRRKRTHEEKAFLQDKILTRNIVIKLGVMLTNLLVEPFRFIYDIFCDNRWTSLFTLVNAYTRLVRKFYYNIENIHLVGASSFKTKVLGKTLTINPRLISEVTGIPLVNGSQLLF
jgi:hypothetical protein